MLKRDNLFEEVAPLEEASSELDKKTIASAGNGERYAETVVSCLTKDAN
jgi:hypothetical protein